MLTREGNRQSARLFGLTPIELFAVAPAATALAVGATYGLGALIWSARLARADIDPADGLPLISLEDLLTTGMATAVPTALVGLLGGLSIVGTLAYLPRELRRGATVHVVTRQPRPFFPLRLAVYVRILVVYGVATTCLLPPVQFASLCFGIVLTLALIVRVHERMRTNPFVYLSAVFGCLFSIVLTGVVAEQVVDPNPLPEAAIRLPAGREITGPLVAAGESRWYIVTSPNVIQTVPLDDAKAAQLDAKVEERESLARQLGCGFCR